MAQAAILIISPDKDFSQPLAEQVKRELNLSAHIAQDEKEAQAHAAAAALIIANQPLSKEYHCPVVAKRAPARLQDILAEADALLNHSEETLPLSATHALDAQRKTLTHDSGKSADLTDKETQLLQTLALAGKGGVSKAALLRQVWGIESELDTHTLETHIYRLRGKFRELSGDDDVILAKGDGYALKASS